MGINEIIQIGTRIKKIRLEKGLTQKEVAERLNIPYSTYSNYENNNREPNYGTIQEIAKILETSVNRIIYTDTAEITSETANFILSLAGFEISEMGNGIYTVKDIENNETVREMYLTYKELNDIVKAVSDYTVFVTDKAFKDHIK